MKLPVSRQTPLYFLFLVVLPLCVSSSAQQPSPAWRYSFRTGDHLIYTETIHRRTESSTASYETELTFANHVLIAKELPDGTLAVGMQRNRQQARLLSYHEGRKDKLAVEQPKFAERVSRTQPQWSETNWLSRDGIPHLPWAAVRESNSRILSGAHEIETLPGAGVKPGDEWQSYNPLGFRFRYARNEQPEGKPCVVAEGKVQSIGLSYWFCPSTGVLEKLVMEGDLVTFAGNVHEVVTLQIREIRHGERMSQWMASPDTRLAALRTAVVTNALEVTPAELRTAVTSDSSDEQVLGLEIFRRRSLPLPGEVAQRLAGSSDARIKQLLESLGGHAAAVSARCASATAPLHEEIPGTTLRHSNAPGSRGDTYILHIPESYSMRGPGSPLIVSLSGGPGLAIDAANGSEATVSKTNYIVLYPNAAGRMWWTREESPRVEALIAEVLAELNVDRSRIYLAGFSNGGTGALYYATLWPERFTAVAALMGAGNCIDEIRPLALGKLAKVPVLFVHGDKDPIIPSECSGSAYKDLRKISTDSELHILSGREHDIVLGNDDDLTLKFFEKHKRCTAP